MDAAVLGGPSGSLDCASAMHMVFSLSVTRIPCFTSHTNPELLRSCSNSAGGQGDTTTGCAAALQGPKAAPAWEAAAPIQWASSCSLLGRGGGGGEKEQEHLGAKGASGASTPAAAQYGPAVGCGL